MTLLLVPAAGRSVRMGGLLKELLPVGARLLGDGDSRLPTPMLLRALSAGITAGVDEILIVTSSAKAATLMEVVDSFELGLPVAYVFQREPAGLGAAVSCAAAQIRRHDATLLHMPDVLITPLDAVEHALAAVANGATVAATLHEVAHPERFGVAQLDGDRLVGFVDKPLQPPSNWVWSAAAFAPSFLSIVEGVRPADGDWGLTEALDAAARSGVVEPLYVRNGSFHDVGTYDGYLAALDEVRRSEPC